MPKIITVLVFGERRVGKSTYIETIRKHGEETGQYVVTVYDRDKFPNKVSNPNLALDEESRFKIYKGLIELAEENTPATASNNPSKDIINFVPGDWGPRILDSRTQEFIRSSERRYPICCVYVTCEPLLAFNRMLQISSEYAERDNDIFDALNEQVPKEEVYDKIFLVDYNQRKTNDIRALEILKALNIIVHEFKSDEQFDIQNGHLPISDPRVQSELKSFDRAIRFGRLIDLSPQSKPVQTLFFTRARSSSINDNLIPLPGQPFRCASTLPPTINIDTPPALGQTSAVTLKPVHEPLTLDEYTPMRDVIFSSTFSTGQASDDGVQPGLKTLDAYEEAAHAYYASPPVLQSSNTKRYKAAELLFGFQADQSEYMDASSFGPISANCHSPRIEDSAATFGVGGSPRISSFYGTGSRCSSEYELARYFKDEDGGEHPVTEADQEENSTSSQDGRFCVERLTT